MTHPKAPRENPIFPEGINTTDESPLKEFALLSAGALTIIAVAAIILWSSFSWLATFIPLSWEQRVADQWVDNTQAPSTIQIQLQERTDRIIAVMAPDLKTTIVAHHIDHDVTNAFATLGGQIFIYQGLLDALQTDIGLDMVIAHEVAHILNRDPIQMAAGMLGTQLVLALATGNGEFAQLSGFTNISGSLLLLNYSREQEIEADQLALDAIEKLYGSVDGAEEFFVYISNREDLPEPPAWLSSHPDVHSRISAIKARDQ